MALIPKSLLGRNTMLIVLLVVIGQIGSALVARELVIKPRLDQIAISVARSVSAIRDGIAALPPQERSTFVDKFNERTTRESHLAHDAERTRVLMTPLERRFVRIVSARVDQQGAETIWRREEGGGLAVRLTIDGAVYWIAMSGALPAREFTGAWVAVSIASALLALFGALWFQRKMNHPLSRMVDAAEAVAKGQSPPPLPEDGPSEIATVSRSFNRMVSSLERADSERALMLAGVSHDLRTPLTKLRLGVEILSRDAEAAISKSMARSIDEMDAIVGQFLDFARSDSAEPMVAVRLDEMAKQVAMSYADHQKPVDLQIGGIPPIPRVPMRAQAIRRAMTNLIENAWRHGAAPVVLSCGSTGSEVWFEVRDHGAGIDPSKAESLKQPFHRADDARAGVPGAGLGLAIVQRVAAAHRGRFDLENVAGGHGLRARVTIPLESSGSVPYSRRTV